MRKKDIAFEKKGYIPQQPAFEIFGNSYDNVIQPPDTATGDIVADFYQISGADFKESSLVTIPDACTDFMFVSDGRRLRSYISTGVRVSKKFYFGDAETLFGIRFMPGGTYRVFSDPVKDLVHHPISLGCIMKNTDILSRQFLECQSFEERVELLQTYIRTNIRRPDTRYEILNALSRLIYAQKGNVTIEELAEQTGYSARYLQVLCNDYIGMSPKEFCQTVRMQYAITLERDNPQMSMETIASLAGYADISHMNREFKKYLSCKLSNIKKADMRSSEQLAEQIIFPD